MIAIFCGFWGVFFTSLFVVTLTNTLKMDPSEDKAYRLMTKIKQREDIYNSICRYTYYGFRYFVLKKKKETSQRTLGYLKR